ncbi:dnaJ homolog subfamily C member 24 isoform X1 [Passer domesticus]|uniref:dnaJ homolog subfamily C member 24 isoform X1 n=1 Tax=Passer domesticus TaxID=48849 RepID=UPI0030FEA8E7
MSSFWYLILCRFVVHTQQNGHQAIEMGHLARMCLASDVICVLQRNLMPLLSALCLNYYHPDKQEADVAAAEAEERVQRFMEIHQAWKILGNEETKKEYDLQQREDNLTKEWPLHEQIYLEDMSWNEDEQLYTLSCRCGGNYSVSKSETQDVSLVCCDTCSLVIEILQ